MRHWFPFSNFSNRSFRCRKFGGCSRDSVSGKMKFGPRAPPPHQKLFTCPAVILSAGKAPTSWLKEPAAGLGYKQKMWTRRHQNGCSVLHSGPPHGHTVCMDVLVCRGLLAGASSWACTWNYTVLGRSRQWPSWAERMSPK